MPPKGSRGRDRGGRGRGRRRSAAGLATGTDVGRESPPTQTPLLTLHTYPPAYPSDSASPYRPLTLLVIGPQPHTSKLSNSIYTAAKHLTNVDLEVREIPSLTWLMRPDDERRRQIDVVVFVIDTSDRPGFAQFKHEVGLLGLEYYMGRCCVVTHSDNGNEIGHVERDELEEWISSISDNIPHFHTSTHVERDPLAVCCIAYRQMRRNSRRFYVLGQPADCGAVARNATHGRG
ncbi:hypothetical protein DFS34DRAFT_204414 [Phlyctochytrium arcticum]|nr:hypothetical protein DFS34DRAFT_204414 [Phlyctochytrium arcticum]